MKHQELLDQLLAEQTHPILFATISGAHLYGFESPDSDYDIRGCHVLPTRLVVGLSPDPETIDSTIIRQGLELDFVSHDAKKFFQLMLKKNGYVLEQIFSPLVLRSGDHHKRLIELGKRCITKHHAHHYMGFSANQWKLFKKEEPLRIKPLLYVYRVLLTGINLMRTGKIEANLPHLNDTFRLPYLEDLIVEKKEGCEKAVISDNAVEFHEREYKRLLSELEQAYRATELPDTHEAKEELNQFLIELRLAN